MTRRAGWAAMLSPRTTGETPAFLRSALMSSSMYRFSSIWRRSGDRAATGDGVSVGLAVSVGFGVAVACCASGAVVSAGDAAISGDAATVSWGNTPLQCSSTSLRTSATVCRPSVIALSATRMRKRLSPPEYCPAHSPNALTTISRSVGAAIVEPGVGVTVAASAAGVRTADDAVVAAGVPADGTSKGDRTGAVVAAGSGSDEGRDPSAGTPSCTGFRSRYSIAPYTTPPPITAATNIMMKIRTIPKPKETAR